MKNAQQIIEQLDAIRNQLSRTAEEIRDAEVRADEAEHEHKRESALAYRRATGSVEDRKQQALLDTGEFAKARRDTSAVASYLKMRRANLEIEQSNLQTQARLIGTEFAGSQR